MNIHEYQAKGILKQFGAPIPNGVVILDLKEINDKSKKLNSNNLILKHRFMLVAEEKLVE